MSASAERPGQGADHNRVVAEPTPLDDSSDPALPRETLVEMARVKGLSDAVVAVALTVLVLDLRIPAGLAVEDLPRHLLELASPLAVYLVSFVVIAGAWGSHQRMLGQIERGDGVMVWLALLSLLPMTLVPACASVLADYPTAFPAIALFAADAILIQLTALWLWRHADRGGLIGTSLDRRVVDSISNRLLIAAAGFGLSIPLALLSPFAAYALWVAVFALIFATDWLSWQRARRSTAAEVPLDGATRASVEIHHAAGRLRLTPAASDDALIDGTFGGGVKRWVEHQDDLARVRLDLPQRDGLLSPRFPWTWGSGNLVDWDLRIAPHVPVALRIETAGGQSVLDLAGLRLTGLDLQTSASSAAVTLPRPQGTLAVRLEASVASIVLTLPPDVPAELEVRKAVAGLELDAARFVADKDRRRYRSADYESAADRIAIDAEMAFGSLRVT